MNLAELETLGARPRAQEMEAKEIARSFKSSVVVLESKNGSGTGFFVGSNGYVLTCAHVLPENGEFQCKYLVEKGRGAMTMTAKIMIAILGRKPALAPGCPGSEPW